MREFVLCHMRMSQANQPMKPLELSNLKVRNPAQKITK